MKSFRVNKITGAVKQFFGKQTGMNAHTAGAYNSWASKMGFSKVASAIKAAPVAQKIGMTVATIAVVGGTAAGVIAMNQPAPTPTPNQTPAPAVAEQKTEEPKQEETKPAEETKSETTTEETRPAEETKSNDSDQQSSASSQNTYTPSETAPSNNAQSEPDPEPAPAPTPQKKEPEKPHLLGYKHILSAWNPDTNEIFRTTYGYDGDYSSREEAVQALTRMIQAGGKSTPRGIEESEEPIYGYDK